MTGYFTTLITGESIKVFNSENNSPEYKIPDVLGYVQNVLPNDTTVEKKAYLVDTLHKKPTLFTYELQLLRGMTFESLLEDTVPVFSF